MKFFRSYCQCYFSRKWKLKGPLFKRIHTYSYLLLEWLFPTTPTIFRNVGDTFNSFGNRYFSTHKTSHHINDILSLEEYGTGWKKVYHIKNNHIIKMRVLHSYKKKLDPQLTVCFFCFREWDKLKKFLLIAKLWFSRKLQRTWFLLSLYRNQKVRKENRTKKNKRTCSL